MKKTLSIILSLICVILIAVSFTACGINFGGKFSEVTDEDEVAAIMEELETALSEDFEEWSGVKLTMDMKMDNESVKGTAFVKMLEDNKVEMSMEIKGKASGVKVEAKAYVKDDTMYINIKEGKNSMKYKMPYDMSEAMDDLFIDPDVIYESLGELFDMGDDFTVSVTADSGARNIKISGGNGSEISVIFALDKNGKIKGMKVELKMDLLGMKYEVNYVYEPYSGKIKFPKDLDSYDDLGSLFDF